MNEQFALELHRAGDAIATLESLATGIHNGVEFHRGHSYRHGNETYSACITVSVRAKSATIHATKRADAKTEIARCVPVNSNLGAVMAKTYRELFGVFEDTETDSE